MISRHWRVLTVMAESLSTTLKRVIWRISQTDLAILKAARGKLALDDEIASLKIERADDVERRSQLLARIEKKELDGVARSRTPPRELSSQRYIRIGQVLTMVCAEFEIKPPAWIKVISKSAVIGATTPEL